MPFIDLNSLMVKEPVPGYRAVFVHSKNMTLAYWKVDEGAVMPEHSHPHEQVASVVEGRFELTLAGETRVLDSGSAAVIPSKSNCTFFVVTVGSTNKASCRPKAEPPVL